jgi:hypothetical protein
MADLLALTRVLLSNRIFVGFIILIILESSSINAIRADIVKQEVEWFLG